jgi:hypothetical protein
MKNWTKEMRQRSNLTLSPHTQPFQLNRYVCIYCCS